MKVKIKDVKKGFEYPHPNMMSHDNLMIESIDEDD